MKIFKLDIKGESIYFESFEDCEIYLFCKYTSYPFFVPKYKINFVEMDENIRKKYLRQNRDNTIDNLI